MTLIERFHEIAVNDWAEDDSPPVIVTNTVGNAFVPKTAEPFYYDYDGNLTNDGRWTYTWDAENRLVRMVANTAVGPQQRIEFEYDAKSRRIGKKVWNNTAGTGSPAVEQKFVYDGWNLLAVLSSSSQPQSAYVWGLDLSGSEQGAGGVGGLLMLTNSGNGTHYCAYDGNGNLAALVKATDGAVTANYEYGPFGEPLRVTGAMGLANAFRFSTKYQDDETDLLYYGYRSYNPSTGRWLSRDPVAEGGLSCYAFLINQPACSVDYLGCLQVKHIGEGFTYVKGPPELFWLGLQARPTPEEANSIGGRGILLTRANYEISVWDCCLRKQERFGTMYYLDRFVLSRSELVAGAGDYVYPMTDGRRSLVFEPVDFPAQLIFKPLVSSSAETSGEIKLDWQYRLLPFSDYLWSGGAFRSPSGKGYEPMFHPEAAHKPFMSYEPVEWNSFAYSEGSYEMTFKWDNCSRYLPEFSAKPHLPVGPQRKGEHGSFPGAEIFR